MQLQTILGSDYAALSEESQKVIDKFFQQTITNIAYIDKITTSSKPFFRALTLLVFRSYAKGSNRFCLKKREIHELMGTTNRSTMQKFLDRYEKLGIIEIRQREHLYVEFDLTNKILGSDFALMPKSGLNLVFEDELLYPRLDTTVEDMASRQETTSQKYRDAISELLAEVSQAKHLEKMSQSTALRDSYMKRVQTLKINIKSFQKRNGVSLEQELSNLDSIARIVASVKIFDADTKQFEPASKRNVIKPQKVVGYFYNRLSEKLGERHWVKEWAPETKAAKTLLNLMKDRDLDFVKGFIDWAIETGNDKVMFHLLQYRVPEYLQYLDDRDKWRPIWTRYNEQAPNDDGLIIPKNEEELCCFFVALYNKHHGPYEPQKLYKRDINDIDNLHTYMNNNLDESIRFLLWYFKKVAPAQKEKPPRPAALYRYISDFRDQNPDQSVQYEKVTNGEREKAARRASMLIWRAAYQQEYSFIETEKESLRKYFQAITVDDLETNAKQVLADHPEAFSVVDKKIELLI